MVGIVGHSHGSHLLTGAQKACHHHEPLVIGITVEAGAGGKGQQLVPILGHNAGIVKRKFQNGIHALLPFFLRGSIKKGIVGQRIRAKLSAQHSGNLPGAFFVQRIKPKGRVGGVKRFVRIVQQLTEHAAAGSVVAVNQGIGRSGGVWRGKAAALIQKQRSGGGIQSVKPAAQVKGDISFKGLRALVVEDNELNAEIAKTVLEDDGALVTRVGDGQQAVELFKEKPTGTFDAILMDLMMPVMDGYTATRKIRELERSDAKTVPIIAMTANAFQEDAEKCIAVGMNAHLAKPLDIEKMKKTIKSICF